MLERILKGEKKKTLSPKQEMDVHHIVCGAYRLIQECRSALPHAKRFLDLVILHGGKGSIEHASALRELGRVERGLKDFKSATKPYHLTILIFKLLQSRLHISQSS